MTMATQVRRAEVADAAAIRGVSLVRIKLALLLIAALAACQANGTPTPSAAPTSVPAPSPTALGSNPARVVAFRLVAPAGTNLTPDDLTVAVDIAAARLAVLDPGAIASAVPPDRVEIRVPPGPDGDKLAELAGRTGRIEVVPLPRERYGDVADPGPLLAVEGEPLPTTERVLFANEGFLSGAMTVDATGNPAVEGTLTAAAAGLFSRYTTERVNEFFALVVDGTVVVAPSINSPISGPRFVIAGGLASRETLPQLAAILASGPHPIPLERMPDQP
jgi:preprotein translocase subunit SecD